MSLSSKTYRDEFILPDNGSVGAINVAAEKQGELHLARAHSPWIEIKLLQVLLAFIFAATLWVRARNNLKS
jgi:hypothetical protein